MDSVLQDIGLAFVHLDDILMTSSSEKELIDDLNAVFRRLNEHVLVICLGKCIISLEFLGQQV